MDKETSIVVINLEKEDNDLQSILRTLDPLELHSSRKKAIDGGLVTIVIISIFAKHVIPSLKELILEYIKTKKISQIKIGDTELRNVTEETIIKLFETLDSNVKGNDKNNEQ